MRHDEFERLYDEHARPLLRFVAYRMGDRALAEDIVADTFERVLRARRLFDRRRGSEKSWLYAIALNLVRDHVRRSAAQGRALEREGSPPPLDDEAARADARLTVNKSLARLSDEQREAVALRFGAELSVPEIARLLEIPLTTAEGRIYGALRRMRADLRSSQGIDEA